MSTMTRITVFSTILLLQACSSLRLDGNHAVVTVASFRSQPEPPIVAVRLLNEPLTTLPTIAPLSIEPVQPIIPDIVENILFDSDSAVLTPESLIQLDEFAIAVRAGDYQILVEGHTDSSHSAEYNHALSEARSMSVKEALVIRGIDETRLVIDYHGETKATASNHHEEGKQQNRRVELRPIKPVTFTPTQTLESISSLKPLTADGEEIVNVNMAEEPQQAETNNATDDVTVVNEELY